MAEELDGRTQQQPQAPDNDAPADRTREPEEGSGPTERPDTTQAPSTATHCSEPRPSCGPWTQCQTAPRRARGPRMLSPAPSGSLEDLSSGGGLGCLGVWWRPRRSRRPGSRGRQPGPSGRSGCGGAGRGRSSCRGGGRPCGSGRWGSCSGAVESAVWGRPPALCGGRPAPSAGLGRTSSGLVAGAWGAAPSTAASSSTPPSSLHLPATRSA